MTRKRGRARRRDTRLDNRKRKLLVLTSSLVLAVVLGVLFLVTRQTEQIETDRIVSFQEAQADIRLRQAYVNQLIERIGKPEYVESVVYNEKQYQSKGETALISLMTTTSGTEGVPLYRGQTVSLVEIHPFAFEGKLSARSEREIIIGLKHEFRHAEQIYSGQIRNFPSTLFRTNNGEQTLGLWGLMQELDAVQSIDAVIMSRERQIEFNTDARIRSLYFSLWYGKGVEIMDPAFLSQLKVEFFASWMLNETRQLADGSIAFLDSPFSLSREEVVEIKKR